MRATSGGSSSAAVPITTRATPASASAAAAASVRTPPPVWTWARPDDRVRDRGHHATVHGLTRAGGVEVDHVDPSRACVREARRDGHRIVAVDGLAAVVTLVQPHHLTSAEVDGRIEVHLPASGGDEVREEA